LKSEPDSQRIVFDQNTKKIKKVSELHLCKSEQILLYRLKAKSNAADED